MDTAWLTSWLTELNLPEYIDTFGNAGYTTPELCATIGDKEKLKSIGVSKVGHLNRLFRAVEKLGSELNGERITTVPEDTIPPTESMNCETQTSKAQTFAQSKSVSLSMEGMVLFIVCERGSEKTLMYCMYYSLLVHVCLLWTNTDFVSMCVCTSVSMHTCV